jgi:hypothetical protein
VIRLRLLAAALAAFALAGVGSASASAEVLFHSEVKETFGRGEQVVQLEYQVNGGTMKCTVVEGTGSIVGTTASSIVISAPTISGCTAFGQKAEWNMNGCQYTVTSNGETHLECPAGKEIVITLKLALCSIRTPPQKITGTTFKNEGSGKSRTVLAALHGENLVYNSTGGACGTSGKNGKVAGTIKVWGYSDAKMTEQVGIWVE